MSNPYMRDALVDEMEENTSRPPSRAQPVGQTYPFDQNAINSAYQQHLGRDAGEADYAAHAGNPGGQAGVMTAIQESPEAKAYAASQQGQQTGTGSTGTAGSSGTAGAAGATSGRYTGFDTARAQDPSTSAKDAFLAASQASGSMPSSKDDAESWFNQYIKQALVEAGYQVDQVVGDKAYVRTRENPGGEWIDFLQNAGGENPMIQWHSSVNDPSVSAGMTAPAGGGTTLGGGTGAASSGILGNTGVLDDINAAVEQMLGEGMNYEDIMALLQSGTATGN